MPLLSLLGLTYRSTAEDLGEGKRIVRRTWVDRTLQKQDNTHDTWTYTMKRVMDGHGRVDNAVLAEMKRFYGSSVYINH